MLRRFITTSATLIAVLVTVPPWRQTAVREAGQDIVTRRLGFGPIWDPPTSYRGYQVGQSNLNVQIDTQQLGLEVVGVLALSVVLAQIPWRGRPRFDVRNGGQKSAAGAASEVADRGDSGPAEAPSPKSEPLRTAAAEVRKLKEAGLLQEPKRPELTFRDLKKTP